MSLISLADVSKRYGSVNALRSVNLSIPEGSITLLVGANGAGKSTLLRLLCGLERPDAGLVIIGGLNLSSPSEYREFKSRYRPGVVATQQFLYADLSVRENLLLHASLQRVDNPRQAVEEISSKLAVLPFLDRQVGHCSQGIQRRASLARALLHRPRLVLLDEPLTNLDYNSKLQTAALLEEINSTGVTVVTATHEPELLNPNGSRKAYHLEHGRVIQ